MRRSHSALLTTLWVYGLLTWGYVVASVLDPATVGYQFGPFSRYVPAPTDVVGLLAFVVSGASFALLRWLE